MRLRLHTRVGLGLLATGLTLLGCADAPHRVKAPPPVRGSSVTPTERQVEICRNNEPRGDGLGCTKMTKDIQEDDPWGRWDCATMGNRVCAPTAPLNFELTSRPGCFMEPSSTPDGWEIIWYPNISVRGTPGFPADEFGFEIPCPTS
jgi:hypothetical protein